MSDVRPPKGYEPFLHGMDQTTTATAADAALGVGAGRDPERKGNWLQTYTGVAFYPLDPRPEEVTIEDIAHHLSMICRYGGAVAYFYSVAEHSYILSRYMQHHYPKEPGLALQALLHDGAEAYLMDVPRPLKWAPEMAAYRECEELIERAIMARFGLVASGKGEVGTDGHAILSDADTRIMIDEASVLLTRITNTWTGHIGEPLGVSQLIMCYTPKQIEMRFLTQWMDLAGAVLKAGGTVRV